LRAVGRALQAAHWGGSAGLPPCTAHLLHDGDGAGGGGPPRDGRARCGCPGRNPGARRVWWMWMRRMELDVDEVVLDVAVLDKIQVHARAWCTGAEVRGYLPAWS